MGDGDGWIECAAGHRHWGRHGAAGLLLTGPGRVVLQHRSIRTHEGGTWALPGGARDSHEDPVQTALREAGEEAGITAIGVQPIGLARADHQGWSYTTVLSRAVGDVRPFAANWESDDVRWWDVEAVPDLPLHPGFAAAWPRLHPHAEPLHIVVDAANVVGSRPDRWWRDPAGATNRLLDGLRRLTRTGIRPELLPGPRTPTHGLGVLLPQIALVVEGRARTVAGRVDGSAQDGAWWLRSIRTVVAPGNGDDAVLAETERISGPTLVVTADRGLRARLGPRVRVAGPTWLLGLIDGMDAETAR